MSEPRYKLPVWADLTISFLSDVVISAGGVLTGATAATHQAELPSAPVLFFALATGLVAGVRRLQSTLRPPPEGRE